MTVITMTREMGSRGRDVAGVLADALGLRLVQHELVEHVADKMQVRRDSVNRFLEGKSGLIERWGIKETDFSLYTTEEILDIAAEGNVLIRGWGAAYILRDVSHVLTLRVCAPMNERVRTMARRLGVEDHEEFARKEIERSDNAHTRMMSHLFRVNWTDPVLYDVVLNTSRLSIDECVELLKVTCKLKSFQETAHSRATLARMKLEARIRTALHDRPSTRQLPASFEVDIAEEGVVTLDGIAYDRAFIAEAEKVILAIDGVSAVTNKMTVIPDSTGV